MRKRRSLLNAANVLTLSRFVFAPIMLWMVLRLGDPAAGGSWGISLAALVILTLTLLSDLFDGTLARSRGEVTNFGKIMDPVADSTFFMTLLFGLASCQRFGGNITIWMPILVLYREVAIHILRRYAALKGNAVPAKLAGKIKMFSQSVLTYVFFLLVFLRDYTWNRATGLALVDESFLQSFAFGLGIFTVAVNILSLIEYSRDVPELIAEYVQPGDGGA